MVRGGKRTNEPQTRYEATQCSRHAPRSERQTHPLMDADAAVPIQRLACMEQRHVRQGDMNTQPKSTKEHTQHTISFIAVRTLQGWQMQQETHTHCILTAENDESLKETPLTLPASFGTAPSLHM